jgi:hypothetical protein
MPRARGIIFIQPFHPILEPQMASKAIKPPLPPTTRVRQRSSSAEEPGTDRIRRRTEKVSTADSEFDPNDTAALLRVGPALKKIHFRGMEGGHRELPGEAEWAWGCTF